MAQDPYAEIAAPDKPDPYASIATETTSTGITVPKGMIDQPDSAVSGFFRRGRETIKGLYHTVVDPAADATESTVAARGEGVAPGGGRIAVPAYRIGKGIYEGEKEAARQTKEQFRTASRTKGDPVAKGLNYARAGTTALSMADPFATGPVANINKLQDAGRSKEALGEGTFDALSLLVGGRTGRKPTGATRLNKLAYATDAESIRPLAHILPDIEETVGKVGKPQTVGQLQNVIQTTMSGYEQQFNRGLAMTKGKMVPSDIADALEQKARTLPPTREGQNIARKLRSAATEYRKPWTPQELNAERMYRNANTQAFHKQSGTAQMAAMRANADTMIDEIVADSARGVLYKEMERQHPGQGFRELKLKESSVLDMFDHFKDHVEKLEAVQAKKAGAPLRGRVTTSTGVHAGGVTPRLHGLSNLIPGGGPLKMANQVTRSAFGPTASATARRTAILGLPVSSLTETRSSTIPPPPRSDNNEGPQE